MKCRFCGAEWEAEGFFCPKCGKNNAQEPAVEETVAEEAVAVEETAAVEEIAVAEEAVSVEEAPKKKGWKIAVAVISCVVLLAAAAAAIWYWVNDGWTPRENNVQYKASYTVSDEEAAKAADKVVATFGDAKLTNGQLQIYYWMQYYNFLEYYGSYLGYFIDLDYTQPLDAQMFEDTGSTWQQYFLTVALDAWKRDVTMAKLAGENNYQLSAAYQNSLDTLEADMAAMAVSSGFADVDEMLHAEMGPGCSFKDYASYLNTAYYGNEWYGEWMDALEPSKADVEAYFDANAADFEASGITKDSAPVVDVRHILVMPEGDGATDASGYPVYTEDAWAAAQAEVFAIYDEWLKGDMTEESFSELAKAKSEDGSASVGGLYEDVTEGQMVENFEEWIMAPGRKHGDHGLIQTQFGYHIMYFVDGTESWYYYGLEQYLYDQGNQMLEEEMAKLELDVSYKKIVLGFVDFSS